MHVTAGDLSPAKDPSAPKLSNITLLEVMDDVLQMERFRECQLRPALAAIPGTATTILEAEMERVSLVAEGSADVHLVECHEEVEPMYPDTTEVMIMQDLETMDVEPQEEDSGELGVQTSDPQAPPEVGEQSASGVVMGELRAPTARDEPTQEEQGVDKSLIEGDTAAEEPMMEAPLTREEPAVKHPASGCE